MHAFGAHRDDLDERDLPYVPEVEAASLPASVTLRDLCPTIYDQRPLMACTANAIAALFNAVARKNGMTLPEPSRLFIYYNERDMEGTVDQDRGAQLRSGLKVLAKFGVPAETQWEYDAAKVKVKPGDDVYASASNTTIVEYRRIAHTANDMRSCLAAGFPFIAGIELYQSALVAEQTGAVPMPSTTDTKLGGHAALCIGYDGQSFTFLNSMGATWGNAGCFTVPTSYLEDRTLTYDLWTFRGILNRQ